MYIYIYAKINKVKKEKQEKLLGSRFFNQKPISKVEDILLVKSIK